MLFLPLDSDHDTVAIYRASPRARAVLRPSTASVPATTTLTAATLAVPSSHVRCLSASSSVHAAASIAAATLAVSSTYVRCLSVSF